MQVVERTEGPERDLPGPPQHTLRPTPRQRQRPARLAGDVLNLLGGALEDLADLLEDLRLPDRLGGEPIGGAADVAEGDVDLAHRLVEGVADQLADAIEDPGDGRLVLHQMSAGGGGG